MQGKQVKGRPIDQRYTNIGLVDFNPAQAPDPGVDNTARPAACDTTAHGRAPRGVRLIAGIVDGSTSRRRRPNLGYCHTSPAQEFQGAPADDPASRMSHWRRSG